jgi:TetR/AcrR family transcriptional regulator, cholesterol catabolism regulator
MNIKERILVKADNLFMRFGPRSVSMNDIAAELGLSKKTLYQYYADKEALVAAVMQAIIINNEGDCNAAIQKAKNAVDEIFEVMEMIEKMLRNMNPSVLYDVQKYHPSTFACFEKHKNEYLYNMVRKNLERGIQEALYRLEINVAVIARFRLESIMIPFRPEFYSKNNINLADVEKEIIEHYLYGIATLKGHKLILKYKQERTKITSNGKTK